MFASGYSTKNASAPSESDMLELTKKYCKEMVPFKPNCDSALKRTFAKDKLVVLTNHQFYELSPDVLDEFERRKKNDLPPLPAELLLHPKRSQAREKLASLPFNRFSDLASDVSYEICRRHPKIWAEAENIENGDPASPTIGISRTDHGNPPTSTPYARSDHITFSLSQLVQLNNETKGGNPTAFSNFLTNEVFLPAVAITPITLCRNPEVQRAVALAVVLAVVLAVIELSDLPESDIDLAVLYNAVKKQIAALGICSKYPSEFADVSEPETENTPQASPQIPSWTVEQHKINFLESNLKFVFDELSLYLADHPTRDGLACWLSRSNLAQSTEPIFQKMLTDAYNELVRRRADVSPIVRDLEGGDQISNSNREPLNEERNDAPQTFTSLSDVQFKNFCGDILYEVCRRYPHLAMGNYLSSLYVPSKGPAKEDLAKLSRLARDMRSNDPLATLAKDDLREAASEQGSSESFTTESARDARTGNHRPSPTVDPTSMELTGTVVEDSWTLVDHLED